MKNRTPPVFFTLDVSSDERSRDAREEQPRNMPDMSVTLDVSRDVRSRDVREEQPENMLRMSATSEVSRPDRSIDTTSEHSQNIPRVVLAITPFSIFAEIILSLRNRQGDISSGYEPRESQFSKLPDSPFAGLIVRHPLASIIHLQVPHLVQLTIGVPESLAACKATSLSSGAPSSSVPSFSTASSRLASELLAARALSVGSASPPSPSSATWAASVGSPESPASSACALPAGISGQRDMARTAARNDLNNLSVGLAEALICSSPGAQFHLA